MKTSFFWLPAPSNQAEDRRVAAPGAPGRLILQLAHCTMASGRFRSYPGAMVELADLTFHSLDVPLEQPFGIATGAQHRAENVLVRLEMEDGTIGWGEAAPVQHISGETRDAALEVLAEAPSALRNCDLRNYREACGRLGEALGKVPSALSAVEIALFDALARRSKMSLCSYFGGAESRLTIDVTVTTGSIEAARQSAAKYAGRGFSTFKVKVGGDEVGHDVRRIVALLDEVPSAHLILDGNTAFTPSEALRLLDELGPARDRVVLFEQPVAAQDFEGLREVEEKSKVRVAADESLRSREDFKRIVQTGGISVVNLKTAKLGVLAAWDLLVAARTLGLGVMVGGMVETEVSMTTSACLAAGVGGVEFADLDTPLFLGERPTRGKIEPWGPDLDLCSIDAGHGVSVGIDEV